MQTLLKAIQKAIEEEDREEATRLISELKRANKENYMKANIMIELLEAMTSTIPLNKKEEEPTCSTNVS
mgnify:CR=1 FL=1